MPDAAVNDSLGQLRALAQAAVEQVWDRHRIRLSGDGLAPLDESLDLELSAASAAAIGPPPQATDEDSREFLIAACGAWLGNWAVDHCGGDWVGLHEPVPPRLRVGGWVFSPIDAVRRVLHRDPAAIRCVDLERHLRAWQTAAVRQKEEYLAVNRLAWDRLGEAHRFTAGQEPLTREALRETALASIDPWLRESSLDGCDLLCLAGGGGLHGPLYAAAGARVTVVDLSDRQLDHDRRIAESLRLPMRLIRASIDRLEPLDDASFDVVVQPVSSCYLPDLTPMYAEIARVLRPGGLYVSQHKQPHSLQTEFLPRSLDPATAAGAGTPPPPAGGDSAVPIGFLVTVPAIDGQRLLPESFASAEAVREPGAAEYLHTLDALLGGMARAGLLIEDLREPPRGDWLAPPTTAEHRAAWLPPYLQVKARAGRKG